MGMGMRSLSAWDITTCSKAAVSRHRIGAIGAPWGVCEEEETPVGRTKHYAPSDAPTDPLSMKRDVSGMQQVMPDQPANLQGLRWNPTTVYGERSSRLLLRGASESCPAAPPGPRQTVNPLPMQTRQYQYGMAPQNYADPARPMQVLQSPGHPI
eukprot:752990-Hanusia_phi.AAC.5